ncbi:MAG: DEAD/DEAH box helicase [Spirochaetaceae bacterium]|jgi:superfamily II DNA/RNA helicase|nr:DEAD/DEAH box helicase [Spirochaetaceae bacterium]
MNKPGETFAELGVSSFFTSRLAERRIGTPTEIQRLVIPRLFAGENALFRSATGTGKTFAYLLPFFQGLLQSGTETGPQLLILAPTLELCSQIKGEADFLLKPLDSGAGLIIGSANINRQIQTLKKEKPKVIVGNPARLIQLERMGKLKLNRIRGLVLDEGDRLIADELLEDTLSLVRRVNQSRQTAACSATMSPRSRERLLPLLGGSAAVLETAAQEILRERISHWALFSEGRRKIRTLCSFLAAVRAKKTLVFTGRAGEVGNIVSQLQYHKVSSAGLHGDLDKRVRKQSLDDFRSGRCRVLVASDLGARGLDFADINYVIALDVPADSEAYIHRAGRTARAGKQGVMVTIGDEEELRRFACLEKKLGIIVYPKILHQGQVCSPQ